MTSHDKRDDLIAWLRDAHSMETGTVDNLERLIEMTDDYPPLQSQLRRHLEVSRRQADDLRRELERLGDEPSAFKNFGMKAAGLLEPLLSKLTSDDLPKNCLAAFAYENFEIASYRSLMGAADELGMTELSALCGRAIAEEQEMADFLFEHLPEITRQYLRSHEHA